MQVVQGQKRLRNKTATLADSEVTFYWSNNFEDCLTFSRDYLIRLQDCIDSIEEGHTFIPEKHG